MKLYISLIIFLLASLIPFDTAANEYNCLPSDLGSPATGSPDEDTLQLLNIHEFYASYLPIVMINSGGEAIPNEPKIMVHMGIIDNGPGNLNHPEDPFNAYDGPVGIELRGSSSQQFPKKSYGFETRRPSGKDSLVSLLGLPAESDWVLYALYSDKSLLRNTLAYHLFGCFGHYSPRTRFVELYLNNYYRGLYVLVEKIKRSPDRVNIAQLTRHDTQGIARTGGYILKLDKSTGSGSHEGFHSSCAPLIIKKPHFFVYEYPKGDDIQAEQRAYIRNSVKEFETALTLSDFKDPVSGYRAHIDLPSFSDYFIINELSRNIDGFRLSTFIFKDRDDQDPRFHAGPVWDYDIAFGNANYGDGALTSGWQYQYQDDDHPVPFWWKRMVTDSYFTGMVRCRWEGLREGVLHTDSINDYIDTRVAWIGEASVRNFTAFPILGKYVWPNPYVGNTYQDEVNYLKSWISDRSVWLDHHLPGTCLQTGEEDHETNCFSAVLFPNPSNGQIRLEIRNPERKALYLKIYQLTGQLVHAAELTESTDITRTIPLPAGFYQVILHDTREQIVLKAMVH